MKLIAPAIFDPFPEVIAAMSLRESQLPHQGDMSLTHNKKQGRANQLAFTRELGFESEQLAIPAQEHSDIVHLLHQEYRSHPGDGIITDGPGWLVGVLVADCAPILLYDPTTGSYGVVHSGWQGSAQNITSHAIHKMIKELHVRPSNLYAWIGPSADKDSYRIDATAAEQFNPKYSQPVDAAHSLLDNKSVICDQLIDCGLTADHIEASSLDTVTNQNLHSQLRDGDESGRMLVAIGVRG